LEHKRLNTNGTLSVVVTTKPFISSAGMAGNGFVFGGTGGVAGANFYLLGSTNLAASDLTNWTRLLTNQFDGNGNFNRAGWTSKRPRVCGGGFSCPPFRFASGCNHGRWPSPKGAHLISCHAHGSAHP
jgi:hypothetical protein